MDGARGNNVTKRDNNKYCARGERGIPVARLPSHQVDHIVRYQTASPRAVSRIRAAAARSQRPWKRLAHAQCSSRGRSRNRADGHAQSFALGRGVGTCALCPLEGLRSRTRLGR